MRFAIPAILSLILWGAIACNKPDEYPQVNTQVSTFSAKVDGKAFSTADIQAQLAGNFLTVSAINNSGTGKATSISISISHLVSLGTYPIDTATSAQYIESGIVYRANDGAINIATNNDVHIAGTFAFEASDTAGRDKSITVGSFDIYR